MGHHIGRGDLYGLITVIALLMGWIQLARQASAVEATQRAVERAESHLGGHSLMAQLQQLLRTRDEILRTCHSNDKPAALAALLAWHDVASETNGLLSVIDKGERFTALVDAIGETLPLSMFAWQGLSASGDGDVAATISEARLAILNAATRASQTVGILKSDSGASA